MVAPLHLAGEPERRDHGVLRRAPGIVAGRGKRRTAAVQRHAQRAQRVAGVPCARAAHQAIHTVHIVRAAVIEHLAQRRGEVVGVAGGDPVGQFGDQDAVTIIRIIGTTLRRETIQRVVE